MALPKFTVQVHGAVPGDAIVIAFADAVDLVTGHAVQEQVVQAVEGFRCRSGAQVLAGTEIIGRFFQRRQAVFLIAGDVEYQSSIAAFGIVDARLEPAVDVRFVNDFVQFATVFAAVFVGQVTVGPALVRSVADEFVDQAFLELDFIV